MSGQSQHGPILVTGANGFVGQRLVRRLRKEATGRSVVAASGPSHPVADGPQIDLCDAAAVAELISSVRPSTIVHLAALSSVAGAARDPLTAWHVNWMSTRLLAGCLLQAGLPVRFVFASSAEVYGDSFRQGTCDETAPLRPLTAYARSKVACEYLLRDLAGSVIQPVILRLFNHFGAGQDLRFAVPSFAAQIARIEAGRAEPVLRVGNLDVLRDFCDVEDVVDAYMAVIAARSHVTNAIYNVGTGRVRSLRSIVDTLRGLSSESIELAVDPGLLRPTDLPSTQGDVSRFESIFGWQARRPLEETLLAMLQHARDKAYRVHQ